MELKKYDNAINSFKEVIEANAKSGRIISWMKLNITWR
jgi:hypothetical protein